MAGGYTLLNDPAEREKDKKTNGGNMEGEKEPLRVPDDTLTPELTCVPPDPPRDLISVFVVTFDPKEGTWRQVRSSWAKLWELFSNY
ncbi:hypothetical protein E2C01_081054 [Portunus trituberculatus]|uniref:Uncharacterized protein n=1 Tax=Portunus trituberculatus TaxID=210409 RepID=A0A5B7IV87_PORTR|nr:hypothetical protein [Portunus trituberculatus]